MECTRWDDEGLLYVSQELDSEASSSFEKHLVSCEFCSAELKTYKNEKSAFFNPAILEEPVSEELDRKITEACSKLPRATVSSNIFMSFVKRGAFAAVLLIFGFGGGVYVAFNFNSITGGSKVASDAKTGSENAAGNSSGTVESQASDQVVNSEPVSSVKTDTVKQDSSLNKAPSFDSRHRGDIKAIVPVDLQGR